MYFHTIDSRWLKRHLFRFQITCISLFGLFNILFKLLYGTYNAR